MQLRLRGLLRADSGELLRNQEQALRRTALGNGVPARGFIRAAMCAFGSR